MIIDGHAHSCGEFYEPAGLIAKLNELNVDKVVLCPGVKNGPGRYNFIPNLARVIGSSDMLPGTNKIIQALSKIQKPAELIDRNEYVYYLHLKYPDRIIQFFWADPSWVQIKTILQDRFEAWGFKGIKLHQCTQHFDFTCGGLQDILNFAEEKELPVFIHLCSLKQIEKFVELIRGYPAVNIIIAHLIGLEIFIRYKAMLNNLYFDISPAPLISPKRIYRAIENFGAERVLLGSDTPFGKQNLNKNLQKVTQLSISENKKKLILGGNLKRILKL